MIAQPQDGRRIQFRKLGDPVLLKPGEQTSPSVFGRCLPIARTVVGVKGMRRVFEHDDIARLAGLRARGSHRLDRLERNALVGPAVETEHRRLEIGRYVDRMLRCQRRRIADETAIPGDTRLELRVMRRIKPGDTSAPAEARDAEPFDIAAIGRCKRDGRIEIDPR